MVIANFYLSFCAFLYFLIFLQKNLWCFYFLKVKFETSYTVNIHRPFAWCSNPNESFTSKGCYCIYRYTL